MSEMTRREFVAAPLAAPLPGLAVAPIALANRNHRLEFDPATAQLLSFRPASGGPEFIAGGGGHPVFVVQYLDSERSFRQIASTGARSVQVDETSPGQLTATFTALDGKDLDAVITVRTAANDPFSRWSLSIRNGAGLAITDVQFPFVVVRYRLDGKVASEALLRPLNAGQLLRAPKPKDFEPDTPHAWQFRPENHDT
jgi:hypothetical protein